MSQFRGILILWFGVGLLYSRSVVGTVRTNKQFSGFFGCNFSDVCKESEVCIDDDLFGNCQDKYREKDYFAYSLKLETLQLLETDLQRLIDAGYDWTNLYTQCVVSNILLSSRLAHEPDRRFCDSRAPVPDWMRRLQRENEAEEKLQKEVEDEEDDDDDDDDDDDEKDVAGAGGEDAMTALQKFIADYESDFKDVGDSNADKRLSDGKFVDVHKYVKATRKKSSSGSSDWVYPRPPPSRRAYESKSRRVFNDDLDDDVEQTRPTESDYEWLTSRYDLRKYLKQLDLKELEVLHKYLTAMKGVLISPSKGLFESAATTSSNNNNNDDGDYYNATPDDYFESGIPTSSAAEKLPFINEVMPDSESAPRPSWQPEYDLPPTARIVPTEFDEDFDSDYDLSKSDVLPIDQIYDEEKFGNDADGEEEETMAELRKTMTPEDAKLLSDLLNGKVKLNELSDDNIEKMTQYVMTLLDDSETPAFGEKEGGKIAAKDETNDDDDDENVDESAMVDNGDRLKDSDVNDNREMLNAQALNRPNNEQSIFSVEVKKAAPGVVAQPRHDDIVAPLPAALSEDDNEQKSGHYDLVLTDRAYIKVDKPFKDTQDAEELLAIVESKLGLKPGSFSNVQWKKDMISFRVNSDVAGANADAISKQIMEIVPAVKAVTGVQIIKSGVGDKSELEIDKSGTPKYFLLTFILCGCIAGILLAVIALYLVKRHTRARQKLAQLSGQGDPVEASKDYQDLCRQRMQSRASEKPEPLHPAGRINSVAGGNDVAGSPSSRGSSTSSWSEEPVVSNMDITTGHIVLSYMEDHLKNKDRLEREWEELSNYIPEPSATEVGNSQQNARKNRYSDILPYDHSRVVLNTTTNVLGSDFINANTITDHDPRNPAYIATQGPLPHTVADFWQMIWEQGSVVIVMLTKLTETGVAMCHRYWPEEGSDLYHIYEVHLVSEHIWCDDYLVRSFYLKNLQTNETRTVTQFHFLTWSDLGIPSSAKALLDFRRKVNKSYRGRSCPIVVHCSDGSGRSGTYCLIDMVLNRMSKGAKEIDISATLEHIRDQRMTMVKTKEQFEFALASVAEEVHAILKALPQ